MADEFTQTKAFIGSIDTMVPQSYISRRAEGADVQFGVAVQPGSTEESCQQSADGTSFLGVSVREAGLDTFAENQEVRIMTQGTIWVAINSTGATAGNKPAFNGGTWSDASKGGGVILDDARFEKSGTDGDVVPIRIWGAGFSKDT